MSNQHKAFQDFNDKIKLTEAKKVDLRTSRDSIRDRIRKYFKDSKGVASPKFYMQGSFAMNTTIVPVDGEFDIDDGIYLQHLSTESKETWPAPATVHRWIIEATMGKTNESPIDKKTCVRVQYARNYHVDLPIYAQFNGEYYLANTESGWITSDPKSITEWFLGQVDANGEQLRRLVRYFKAWNDYQSSKLGKLANGLILSALCAMCYVKDDRDDIALSKTAAAMSLYLSNFDVQVPNPVNSTEDLCGRLSAPRKERFKDAFGVLSSHAASAVCEDVDDNETSRLWTDCFGNRFPQYSTSASTKNISVSESLAAFASNRTIIKPWGFNA